MKGGVGNVLGVVVGVLIMGALQNGLNIMGVSPYWQQICKGLLLLLRCCCTMRKDLINNESISYAWRPDSLE